MNAIEKLEKRLEAIEGVLGTLEKPKQARHRTVFCDELVDHYIDVERIQRVVGNLVGQTGTTIRWSVRPDRDGSFHIIGEIEHGL